ncbi:MAG: outer membrane protein assembly factor BamD [candidate division KSB1 bacterium]|nr:outer membrane protein assembly factor BamD [candidate division KSB1 bacterium]MDZ7302230.1 outer membrane protein assembly factor BamD [candidate division KSB1 bacterium]MDZ7311336.1 outer membrane protein assembly factor BamD [candidate division KSB1 bacterium]
MDVRLILQRLICLVVVLIFLACGGSKPKANMTTEERFDYAMKLFNNKDYFDARPQFRIIILNAPGNTLVDQAQYYLAECHFHMEEFITAASEYEKVIRLYPRSELLDDAQYKIGLCYDKLSPKSDLDQKYTLKAIEEYQRFLEEYPMSELVETVEKRLLALRNKLARKEFNTGNLYRKMAYYEAAIYSFDEVLNHYYDSRHAEAAFFYKGECLFKLQRWDEAKITLEEFLQKYPQSSFRSQAKAMLNQISRNASAAGSVRY